MRVLLDTNVWVSAYIARGEIIEGLWQALVAGRIEACVSAELLQELRDVLARPRMSRFQGHDAGRAAVFCAWVAARCECVEPTESLRGEAPDPGDDIVLEAALAGGVAAIVTGDAALLAIGTWRGIPIISPRELLALLPPPTDDDDA